MTEQQKIILVTGASSGIGAATAQRLAIAGHVVVAGARRPIAAAERLEPAHLDVTDRDSMTRFVTGAAERHGRVDVLVANAGVMPLSRLDALLVDEWDRMIDVNVRGLLHGIAAVLPFFQRQGAGHLITTASVGAHEVVPTSAVYSGTKYAAWAITEGLRQESEPGIRVTTITPGVTESELAGQITDPYARAAMTEYRRDVIAADAVARAVQFAIDQPADVDVNEIIVRPTRQRPAA
ncbi:SDR family oxidoreductase [Paractinoplanes brasiliensis]|uniref:NADP-dependent 3-hydroxy acid dehydrogenase YdfG n=1 Tax=Paractinoplanes brasiliensis TaxID=52695 RepID=A0A4R6JNH6_9ACTN|nr:SDR family oxidoreductase [Actinoplanes brasiliensis]TDO37302.1 NADP-dependent 3-hydroxy acid dehydrogenase YdfG [Actinoplanes brasiliensis]GID29384.1 oxidoreductase [Actinoplanes brasiliensis]